MVKVTVKGLASKTSLSANDRDYRYGYRPTLTASISPSAATGTVTFKDGSKVLGTATVGRQGHFQGAGPDPRHAPPEGGVQRLRRPVLVGRRVGGRALT